MTNNFKVADFLKKLLDAIPTVVILLDKDLRIVFRNTEAGGMFRSGRALRRKFGDVLNCVNSSAALGGCGKSRLCGSCSLRKWVVDAIAGKGVSRGRVRFERQDGGTTPILVTTAPFNYGDSEFSLVAIEDIGELEELRSLLPICCGCKKIRDDKDYWQSVEAYMETHMDNVRFTHGICPECAKKMYGEALVKNRRGKMKIVKAILLSAWVVAGAAGLASAHCDSMDGPVVGAARVALESGDPAGVLAWVRADDEAAILEAFRKAREVRMLGGKDVELADTWFFETLVRGAPGRRKRAIHGA